MQGILFDLIKKEADTILALQHNVVAA